MRVHPEILAGASIPGPLVTKQIWKERFEDIRAFERYLARQGYVIRKFFLHISQKEQLKRLRKRLDEPEKNWKFNLGDLKERARWNDYMKAYEDLIQNTATPEAPWVVVPGNKKWFARIVVAATIIDALENLDLKFPKLDGTRDVNSRKAVGNSSRQSAASPRMTRKRRTRQKKRRARKRNPSAVLGKTEL